MTTSVCSLRLTKGKTGYRYYTYQQSAQLENILAMRQLNMSIEEIAPTSSIQTRRIF